MSNCDSCASNENCSTGDKDKCNSKNDKVMPKYGNIKNIIGIISGKGGVGKSTVTGLIAAELRKAGYKVGVLDGDVTGPSMPRFFGVNKERAKMIPMTETEVKFIPVETEMGIKLISLNLLIESEDEPVIWRGPVITGALSQMYTDTEWGELDYLLIDMPPGTGDIALTVMQTMPVKSMIVVSTPQDMVSMIVKKVVIMIEKMNIPIVGVVENMSYIKCNNCGDKIRVFSKKTAEEQARYLGVPLLAEMPINLDLVESLERGTAEKYISSSNEYKILVEKII
ncbi:Mrp/NBP35 family ATP-binding protein [Clostridium pasteurianum]|uniref:Iron-sulfur cluster carrier protein n=1 Tax=Clostridium pasteurianum BC1 TaxID=86416 RepID=R4K0L6_CLOPA|nr:Mrp/NBP35 family ATP-binding protein [Clostridium pasteurianum]AGK95326.1 ATPase involved in chromosome partitioning [Clostridium pasteurianum BC1]